MPYGTRKLITLKNVRAINLHDIAKCNKSENISRNCELEIANGACQSMSVFGDIQLCKTASISGQSLSTKQPG